MWMGESEDAKSFDALVTSATLKRKPIPAFEDLDSTIVLGLTRILTNTAKKASHQSRWKSTVGEDITQRTSDCLDDR